MEPTTALSRVEAVLQASETGLFLHQIAREAHINEKEAKEAIKALNARAQIETIPTPGRWGSRYAWLAAKSPLPKVAGPGERAAQVDKPESEVDKPESEVDKTPNLQSQTAAKPVQARMAVKGESGPELVDLPMLGGTATEAFMEAVSRAAESLPRAFRNMLDAAELEPTLTERMASYYGAHYQQEPARYAVAVPRRPLRIVKTRARAEALALAAVRRGAKSAEVFALTAVGRARRDAVFVETE